jgi:hypothetical protein
MASLKTFFLHKKKEFLIKKEVRLEKSKRYAMMKKFQISALSLLGLTSALSAAGPTQDNCCSSGPAPCYPDSPPCAYCVGPDMVNPSVRPRACDGSWLVTLAGFYWNSHQDGMEFAVDNSVFIASPPTDVADVNELNNLIDAEYLNPNSKWDFGFKAGLAYNSTHDGWDLGVLWTWYKGRASNHVEAESDDNHTLLPLWSAEATGNVSSLWASDIDARWSFELNLVDVELGREFWVSKYLTFRPHIGLRFASINQNYTLEHRGGFWAIDTTVVPLSRSNNEVEMRNDFNGVGARGGFNTVWNIGKGVAFFGQTAVSVVYGRFKVKHEEWNRLAQAPHSKTRILETEDHFKASRAMTDLALGIQWSTPFGQQCQYGFTLGLAWEHHMFFEQNQMWRVNRLNPSPDNLGITGENAYYQRRGDLDTQGWTLTVQFEF